MRRLLGAATAAGLILVASACGGDQSSAVMSVRIVSGSGPSRTDQRFTLRCDPTGGDMPNRIALCRMIAKHPQAMLTPGRPRSLCLGGPGLPPSVSVSGRWRGRSVRLNARVMCEWPGGVAALAYWAAADSPHFLRVASVRLRCDEDPSLQKAPTPWARVRACLRAPPSHWQPSNKRPRTEPEHPSRPRSG
jgi:hypothetical protein